MNRFFCLGILIVGFTLNSFAQSEQKLIRRGNRAYSKNDFLESEVQYRQALEKNRHSFKANFNLADALYKQNKFDDAYTTIDGINVSGLSDSEKSMVFYNKGNTLFKQNKLKESIEAYKMALKFNPNDMDAKYNLSEAIRMMQNQQNQQNQNKDQDQKKDDNKDNNKDNKDQNKDNQDKNQNKDDNKSQQPQNQPKISKEDAERMLQALQQREKEIRDKLNKQQAKPVSGASIKNW